jgi:hypothetical protein
VKNEKPKMKFVVQRTLGVECDTPEQAVELTTSKEKAVTSIGLSVQPANIQTPVPTQPSSPTALEKLQKQKLVPKVRP